MDKLRNKCLISKNMKRIIALKSKSLRHYAQRASSSRDINAECKQLHDTFDKSVSLLSHLSKYILILMAMSNYQLRL